MYVPSDISLKAITKLYKLRAYTRKEFPHEDLYPGSKKARITSQNPEIKNSNKIERKRQQTPQLDQHNVNTRFARSWVGGMDSRDLLRIFDYIWQDLFLPLTRIMADY